MQTHTHTPNTWENDQKYDIHQSTKQIICKEGEEGLSKCQFLANHQRTHGPGPPNNRLEKDGGQARQPGSGRTLGAAVPSPPPLEPTLLRRHH